MKLAVHQGMQWSVLLIDDDDDVVQTLSRIMRFAGIEAVPVTNTRLAVQLLNTIAFDAVVTDMFMPEVDGLGIIAKCRALQPQARIVAISGGGTYQFGDHALALAQRLGADTTLQKPFNGEALLTAVRPLD